MLFIVGLSVLLTLVGSWASSSIGKAQAAVDGMLVELREVEAGQFDQLGDYFTDALLQRLAGEDSAERALLMKIQSEYGPFESSERFNWNLSSDVKTTAKLSMYCTFKKTGVQSMDFELIKKDGRWKIDRLPE